MEEWRDIPGYEGAYQVSDQGRVRSLDRWVEQGNRWGTQSRRWWPGQMLKANLDSSGYAQVSLPNSHPLVHHLVMAAFGPPRPQGHECDHRNGVRSDNRIVNLLWRTRRDQGRNRHHVRNRTGFIGVSENPKGGPNPFWASARDREGKKVFLGMHPTAEAASAAYLAYRETQFACR
jgi:hypothetical protein